MKKILTDFSPESSVFSLPIFRWSVGFLIVLAMASFVFILCTSNLVYMPGYEGLNNALVIFKVPLGCLAAIFPVYALISVNHRSVQSAHQIEKSELQIQATNEQNLFSNYYKHLEEFCNYVESVEDKNYRIFHSDRTLHQMLFPEARSGNYSVPLEVQARINCAAEGVGQLVAEARINKGIIKGSHWLSDTEEQQVKRKAEAKKFIDSIARGVSLKKLAELDSMTISRLSRVFKRLIRLYEFSEDSVSVGSIIQLLYEIENPDY